MKKLNKKIDNLDFSIIDISISEIDLKSKLIGYGYTNTKDIFHKVVDENCGDGNIVHHYYATIYKTNEVVDIQDILKSFGKGMTTYNIGYIFINENVDENIEIIKNYIKATILDVKVHPYKYKKFFVPILINNNKVYYIKEKRDIYEYIPIWCCGRYANYKISIIVIGNTQIPIYRAVEFRAG